MHTHRSWRSRAITLGVSVFSALMAAAPACAHVAGDAGAYGSATNLGTETTQVIVQLEPGASAHHAAELIRSLHGRVTGDLHIIHGLAAQIASDEIGALRASAGVASVDVDAPVKPQATKAAASW